MSRSSRRRLGLRGRGSRGWGAYPAICRVAGTLALLSTVVASMQAHSPPPRTHTPRPLPSVLPAFICRSTILYASDFCFLRSRSEILRVEAQPWGALGGLPRLGGLTLGNFFFLVEGSRCERVGRIPCAWKYDGTIIRFNSATGF